MTKITCFPFFFFFFPSMLHKMKASVCVWRPAQEWEGWTGPTRLDLLVATEGKCFKPGTSGEVSRGFLHLLPQVARRQQEYLEGTAECPLPKQASPARPGLCLQSEPISGLPPDSCGALAHQPVSLVLPSSQSTWPSL